MTKQLDLCIIKEKMRELLNKMVEEYNTFSQVVAFHAYYEDGESAYQWETGYLKATEEYMEKLAELLGIKLRYEFSTHGCSFHYLTVEEV